MNRLTSIAEVLPVGTEADVPVSAVHPTPDVDQPRPDFGS
jgi:hypothetical protein